MELDPLKLHCLMVPK